MSIELRTRVMELENEIYKVNQSIIDILTRIEVINIKLESLAEKSTSKGKHKS
jgi:hypothetical protein